MTFKERLAGRAEAVRACLGQTIDALPPSPIRDGMRYATAGGKGIRGFLVMEASALFDVPASRAQYAAAAIEALHSYSLVHDDLPAMDDDDLRRGQPTVHIKWDEASAILVGDGLQSLAFELLTRPELTGDPAIRVELVASLARAAGSAGMVLGQALDIAAETSHPLSLDAISQLQALKTGALIRWSAEAGARLGGADPDPLGRYAASLGLAFQIADDILDETGDVTKMGKAVGKDRDAGKATFVSHLGLGGAKRRASELVDEAVAALDGYGAAADGLRDAAQYVISRDV